MMNLLSAELVKRVVRVIYNETDWQNLWIYEPIRYFSPQPYNIKNINN